MTARLGDNLDQFFNKAFQKIEKQLGFASVLAANEIAKDVVTGLQDQLDKDIDRPTPFTKRAFKIKRANRKTLSSEVSIKPVQAEYLKYQIKGGTRRNKTVIIPRKKQTNKYGNLPRGKLKRLSSQGKTYIANDLIIQRQKRKQTPVAFLTDKATYKPRFKFFERARSEAKLKANQHVQQSIRKALATAR